SHPFPTFSLSGEYSPLPVTQSSLFIESSSNANLLFDICICTIGLACLAIPTLRDKIRVKNPRPPNRFPLHRIRQLHRIAADLSLQRSP
ncbi:hypothetical protein BJY04DRAFT_197144, partial [Aspergillus karnatakaensis]|uniref:uncharacterized protein n=1 Tax=Aspergillus karnatakaensis TaxID=1810916 RepID=UPI003CCD531C